MPTLTSLLPRRLSPASARRATALRETRARLQPLSTLFDECRAPNPLAPQADSSDWADTSWGWHDSSQSLRDGLHVSEHDDDALLVEFA
jgi:hypothetical protein